MEFKKARTSVLLPTGCFLEYRSLRVEPGVIRRDASALAATYLYFIVTNITT